MLVRPRKNGSTLLRLSRTLLVFVIVKAGSAQAQARPIRWVVDPATSLAWWQMNPHYSHLWATTCPDDPSWQPGEGRTAGYYIDVMTRQKTYDAATKETRIPLYPRKTVRPVCTPAVQGEVTSDDTVHWTNVRGTITVASDKLVTGNSERDRFTREKVLEVRKYPAIRFALDSLLGLQLGDTMRATVLGAFELHGVSRPIQATVKGWHEPLGLRVQAQWEMPAEALTKEYAMSKMALGMGVTLGRWKTVNMGIDMILRPSTVP